MLSEPPIICTSVAKLSPTTASLLARAVSSASFCGLYVRFATPPEPPDGTSDVPVPVLEFGLLPVPSFVWLAELPPALWPSTAPAPLLPCVPFVASGVCTPLDDAAWSADVLSVGFVCVASDVVFAPVLVLCTLGCSFCALGGVSFACLSSVLCGEYTIFTPSLASMPGRSGVKLKMEWCASKLDVGFFENVTSLFTACDCTEASVQLSAESWSVSTVASGEFMIVFSALVVSSTLENGVITISVKKSVGLQPERTHNKTNAASKKTAA